MARYASCLAAVALAANMVALPVHAQSAASELSAVSALPLASVVVASGVSTVAQASAQVLVAGASLVVRAVESTARGTVFVLERLSDGVRVSVEVASQAAGTASGKSAFTSRDPRLKALARLGLRFAGRHYAI